MLIALVIYTVANFATSFAPEIASFTVFRILAAAEATCFLVVGATICGDLYVVVRMPFQNDCRMKQTQY